MSAESMANTVALVTSDQSLAASVRELATAAGLAVEVLDRWSAMDTHENLASALVLVDSRSWDSTELSASIGSSGVMLAVEPDGSAWEHASISGFAEVIAWPQGAPWLARRFGEMVASSASRAQVIAVVGGRGGCGATTLAVSLGVAAVDQGMDSVLIDADSHSPGLSRSLGIGDGEGLRWADFADISEPLTAAGVHSQLAVADGLSVLTGPWGPNPPSVEARRYTRQACELAFDLVVVDVPRYELNAAGVDATAFWLLMTTLEVRPLMTTAALLAGRHFKSSPLVVVRSDIGPVPYRSAQGVLSPAELRQLKGSRGICGAADFGDLATAVGRGPIADMAQGFVSDVRNGRFGS